MSKIVPLSLMVVGFALMAFKIVEDSEPGAIPLLLVLVGGTWHFIRRRKRVGK